MVSAMLLAYINKVLQLSNGVVELYYVNQHSHAYTYRRTDATVIYCDRIN